VAGKEKEIVELEGESIWEGFWNDPEKAGKVMQKLEGLREETAFWRGLEKEAAGLEEMALLAAEEEDEEIKREIEEKLPELEKTFTRNEFHTFMNGRYDAANAIVTIRSGAGGVDAMDFAEMLLRMYLRYAERKNFKAQVIHDSRGEEAGIKSATFKVNGRYAYGFLKTEAGVHRLVRLSPFNADSLRQTSFASVEVLPEVEDKGEIEIKEEEIRIDTYRSSGAGGQHVNKTDSAVRITHIPTGIVVACQNERSQMQNKEQAMNLLRSKLYALKKEQDDKEQRELRGEYKSAEWGNQIRSYVLHPYKMVKDHRTKEETAQVDEVLDGDIERFIEARLRS
jgi:peptide chain release factor 2